MKRNSKGFSLVELMVVISIFMLISSVVVISKKKFGETVSVTNSAADLAGGIRQAQVFATSAKASSGGTNFQTGYGVHVSKSMPGKYVLFNDKNNDNYYEPTANTASGCLPNTECISVVNITKGNTISNFCADTRCQNTGGVDAIDIVFRRPKLEPIISPYTEIPNWSTKKWLCFTLADGSNRLVCSECASGSFGCGYRNPGVIVGSFSTGSFNISSDGGATKTVIVSPSGQVSFQ